MPSIFRLCSVNIINDNIEFGNHGSNFVIFLVDKPNKTGIVNKLNE